MLVSVAVVSTDASTRYAKQLLSHLGHKVAVEPVPDEPAPAGRLVFAYGVGTVRPTPTALELRAAAADRASLARVQDVLARHLVRFGARRELVVTWGPASGSPEPGTDPDTATPPSRPTEDSVRIIHTDDAPSHVGPVPQAVEAGGWIYVSALFGAAPADHAIPEDAEAEANQVFDNLTAILAAAGVGLRHVVRVGIVMRDLQADRPTFNRVWQERFGEHRPARSAIESPAFGRPGEHARFMIEVTAYRG